MPRTTHTTTDAPPCARGKRAAECLDEAPAQAAQPAQDAASLLLALSSGTSGARAAGAWGSPYASSHSVLPHVKPSPGPPASDWYSMSTPSRGLQPPVDACDTTQGVVPVG